jgi:molybdopterin/thiamine biosynthesis adenylyltransferase/nitroreductase
MKQNFSASHAFGSTDKDEDLFFREAFSRNLGLISEVEQDVLRNARVAIAGMGGVGGSHLITMTRAGVGRFNLAEYDTFEAANINRQYGAKTSAFSKPKLDTMVDEAMDINPYLSMELFHEGVNKDNISDFLRDVDVVLDGIDFFAFDARRLLFNAAYERGIPVVTAGPLGFSTALLVFMPGKMSFEEYFDFQEGMSDYDKIVRFLVGLSPKGLHADYTDPGKVDLVRHSGPSFIIGCLLSSAAASMEAVRILLKRPGVSPVPHYRQFDIYHGKTARGKISGGNKNPLQKMKIHMVKSKVAYGLKRHAPFKGIDELAEDVRKKGVTSEFLDTLIEAGVQAPSGDNVQPWVFRKRKDGLDLYADFSADTSFFNYRQFATLIACGAAAENISLLAAASGLKTQLQWAPDKEQPEHIAQFTFTQGEGDSAAGEYSSSIWQRSTNRRPFNTMPLAADVVQEMHDATQKYEGIQLSVFTQRQKIKEAAQLVYTADRIRAERRDLHEHFMKMVRFTPDAMLSTGDGLSLKNLEAGFGGEQFLKSTREWSVMNAANSLGMSRVIAGAAKKGILASGGVGLLFSEGTEDVDYLEGGRALQKIWLMLEHKGIRFQPMTAVTLFWMRYMMGGEGDFSAEHGKVLKEIGPGLRALFPEVDFDKNGLIMLFRMGYGPDTRYGTIRRDVASFRAED